MASLKDFDKRMQVYGKRVETNAPAAVRRIALAVDRGVVTQTPVDTSRARSNWVVSLNSPVNATRDPYSPGTDGSTAGASTQAALDQGARTIEGYRGGGSIWIVNNVDYINKLNAGSSAQAPAGFVEKAVQAGMRSVADFKILDRSS